MFKGIANLGQMMQQAQQMGAKMQAVQEQLKTKKATPQGRSNAENATGRSNPAHRGSERRPVGVAAG
ncbi:MAG: hypothetical protein AAGF23_01735 [Acidobacteriota bacterium]